MTNRDSRDGLSYCVEVAERLWPSSVVEIGPPRAGTTRSWHLLPSPQRPRLAVPNHRPAAAAVLRMHSRNRGGRAGAALRAGALAAGMGALRLDRRRLIITSSAGAIGPGIDVRLAEILGGPIFVGWSIGPKRANRKPVLQVVGPSGQTVGYAKAAYTALARRLVEGERRALRRLAGASLVRVSVPAEVCSFGLDGVDVLVQAPVDTRTVAQAERKHDALLLAAMQEVAGVGGSSRAPLAQSPWWQQVGDHIGTARVDDDARALTQAWHWLGTSQAALSLGAWHGDWNPGNFAVQQSRVTVWDWERFGAGVPVGFDAQHLAFQTAVTRERVAPDAAARWVISTAPGRLASWGLDDHQAHLTALAHLTELGVRYLLDGQREAGADLGQIDEWLIPALMNAISHSRLGEGWGG